MKHHLNFIDGRKRPKDIQSAIDSAWEEISKDNCSRWRHNGEQGLYHLAQVNEYLLLKSIILKKYPKRRDFYVLDIGAGNFRFSDEIINKINETPEIPEDITVHVIGVRGEQYSGDEIVYKQKCIQYNLGYFKIEDIVSEFIKRKIFLIQKIDLIVSQWCFRHLVDPLGTFIQVFNTLLRPISGYFLLDGFSYIIDEKPLDQFDDNNMFRLLEEIQAAYLVEPYDKNRSLHRYIAQKPNHKKCWLPLQYETTETVQPRAYQIDSGKLCKFKSLEPTSLFMRDVRFVIYKDSKQYFGSEAVYNDLANRGCMVESSSYRSPLFILDANHEKTPNEVLASEIRPTMNSIFYMRFFLNYSRKIDRDIEENYSCVIS